MEPAGAGEVQCHQYHEGYAEPYCVITAENAWSKPSSEEIFNAVPKDTKEMYVIPEASHFDMYDLAPFVSEAFEYIIPFFGKNL